ncbi:hypothetical protein BH09MYX1_BH09MYX1_09790 [soil metagenome]
MSACSSGDDTSTTDGGTDAVIQQPCAALPSPVVETVGSLSVGRYSPSVAAIGAGKYLVAGGYDFQAGLASSAEIVEPMKSGFSKTGGLEVARNFSAVALLDPTHVIVAGGFSGNAGSVAVTEIYDVTAGTFSRTGNLSEGREAHSATALKDGRVLVLGGLQAKGFVFSQTGETFDPKAATFTALAAKMSTARAFHVAGLSDDGTIAFAAGGATASDKETATIELFAVAKSTFSVAPGALQHAAKALGGARLSDGRWLLAGGSNTTDKTLTDAQIFDPKVGSITKAASMGTRRIAHSLTTLADGRVLAIGGYSDSTTPSKATNVMEVYDPKTDTWEQLPVGLSSPRLDHVAVLLPDCRVAVIGGQYSEDGKASFATYDVELVTVPFKR